MKVVVFCAAPDFDEERNEYDRAPPLKKCCCASPDSDEEREQSDEERDEYDNDYFDFSGKK